MKNILFVGIAICIGLLIRCTHEPDMSLGVLGEWKCTNVAHEVIKPTWAESNLGAHYEDIISKHENATKNSIFRFFDEGIEEGNYFSIVGDRELFSYWTVMQESKSLNVNLTAENPLKKRYDADMNRIKVRSNMRTTGFDYGLYEGLEEMSWFIVDFEFQKRMVVTESLADGSILFTYELESL